MRASVIAASMAAAGACGAGQARAEDTEEDPARSARPQAGDRLCLASSDGTAAGLIRPADLVLNARPLLAWPYDPERKFVRDGSRLNQLLVLRLDPASLEEDERPNAAAGMLAFSAICTHAQCTVSDWHDDSQILRCPCHNSEYDPRASCRVVFGPAPRRLATLPLRVEGDELHVAAPFIGHVGMPRPG